MKLTLIFLIKDSQVLLAMKKRGFGEGKWNGVGGKVDEGETVEQALIREAQEEISVTPIKYDKASQIEFDEIADSERRTVHVSVYRCKVWEGKPTESEEMAPKWFNIDNMPFDEMWDDDRYWLPRVLRGDNLKCYFKFDEHGKVIEHTIKEIL